MIINATIINGKIAPESKLNTIANQRTSVSPLYIEQNVIPAVIIAAIE